ETPEEEIEEEDDLDEVVAPIKPIQTPDVPKYVVPSENVIKSGLSPALVQRMEEMKTIVNSLLDEREKRLNEKRIVEEALREIDENLVIFGHKPSQEKPLPQEKSFSGERNGAKYLELIEENLKRNPQGMNITELGKKMWGHVEYGGNSFKAFKNNVYN